ncbi:hypothetical protein GALMADRAFT_578720 [Galerina marginata CBS 339.88]|uniref:Protein kinase domain-containing protein n=1 Tax=Galerina marginata (strain CBS 339.88) TaxID=685588 RepID=A0A067SW97_GALM3|nr:hypothetical protein GALMADRAFT_578720 [Galerina marginata CBS 339.88]
MVHGDLRTDNIALNLLDCITSTHTPGWKPSNIQIQYTVQRPKQFIVKYLVEAADFLPVMDSLVDRHGRQRVHAIVMDFGSASCVLEPIPGQCTLPYISTPELQTEHLTDGFYNSDWCLQGNIWLFASSIQTKTIGRL